MMFLKGFKLSLMKPNKNILLMPLELKKFQHKCFYCRDEKQIVIILSLLITGGPLLVQFPLVQIFRLICKVRIM